MCSTFCVRLEVLNHARQFTHISPEQFVESLFENNNKHLYIKCVGMTTYQPLIQFRLKCSNLKL